MTDTADTLARPPETDRPGDFMPLERVVERAGLSRSTIYEEIKKGRFPKPVLLTGSDRGKGRRVAWVEADIVAWQEWKIRESRGTVEPWAPPESDHA